MPDEVWSIPALKTHIDQRFVDLERHWDDAIERIDERHRTFEVQVEEAKKAANEWRGALSDRERYTVSRNEYDTKMKALEDKLDTSASTLAALLAASGEENRASFKKIDEVLSTQRGGHLALTDLRVWITGAGAFALGILGAVRWK